ncbi:MAG: hypothetical protein ABI855_17355 [Bacteroidota bacterium]
MGYIKEPKGVDLIVAPSVLNEEDRKMISQIIAEYKRTGKIPLKSKRKTLHNVLSQSGRLDKKQNVFTKSRRRLRDDKIASFTRNIRKRTSKTKE